MLQTWLRLQHEWATRPAILAEPIDAPLFVVGPPRTGTTILLELLALDPATARAVRVGGAASAPARAIPNAGAPSIPARSQRRARTNSTAACPCGLQTKSTAITLEALEPNTWPSSAERSRATQLLSLHQPTDDAEREDAHASLRALFLSRTRDEWVAEFAEVEACLGPVNSLSEALHDPQVQALGTVRRADYGASGEFGTLALTPRIEDVPFEVRHAPPTLGEQTREILHAAGYTDEVLTSLRDEGAILVAVMSDSEGRFDRCASK